MAYDISQVLSNYHWMIEANGYDTALIQTFTPPPVKIGEMLLGADMNETDVKIPGKKTVGDAVAGVVIPYAGQDVTWWRLLQYAAEGNIQLAMFNCTLHQRAPGGAIVRSFYAGKTFAKGIDQDELKKKASEVNPFMEKITLAPRDWKPLF